MDQGLWDGLINLSGQIVENWQVNLFYLLIGAVIGSLISVWYSINAKRPKLYSSGHGSGPSGHTATISNNPSYFGMNINGDTAQEVRAYVKLKEKDAKQIPLYWGSGTGDGLDKVDIAAHKNESLRMFKLAKDSSGYCILDRIGDPIIIYNERELKFELILIDLLNRRTKLDFLVKFDNSHLKSSPSFGVFFKRRLIDRIRTVRGGFEVIKIGLPGKW